MTSRSASPRNAAPPRSASSPVVRRSALESRHVALEARWVDDGVRWPAAYGGDVADPGATSGATPAGLAEIGPLEEWLLRGPGALAALDGAAAAPVAIGRVVPLTEPASAEAWILGPDEVLLVASIPAPGLAAAAEGRAGPDVSVIEMTGARTTVRLAGPAAPSILAELCPADTRPATMAPGDVVQAPLASVRAFIARQDAAGGPGYTLMIARDEAAYAWDAIVHVGAAHGLRVVGPSAIAPMSALTDDAATAGGAR